MNLPRPTAFLTWLQEHFPQARLLVVGGSVRDALRGQASKDLDLEVVGADAATLLPALPWPHKTVGRSFSHQLVQLEELGWVELSVESEGLDQWQSLCRRRDFTCNALAWDPLTQTLIDPLGGQAHLAAGVLYQASPDSVRRDPLRIWRAAQFCARFGWRVSAELQAAIADNLAELPALASERVTREWEKLLVLPERPSLALNLLDSWGVIAQCYPELAALHDCAQDPTYHPEGDVWVHTLMVLDEAAALARQRGLNQEERLQLGLAALLHDLGKPSTTEIQGDGRITAHGHEAAGVKPARRWLDRHCFGEEAALAALDCVALHMRPGQLTKDIERERLSPSQSVNALRRLLRDLQHVSWEVFITLCEADRRGRGGAMEEFAPGRVLGQLLADHPVQSMARATLLQGRDLLALGLPAGPEVGKWIKRVEQARDEGLVATAAEALEWVRARL